MLSFVGVGNLGSQVLLRLSRAAPQYLGKGSVVVDPKNATSILRELPPCLVNNVSESRAINPQSDIVITCLPSSKEVGAVLDDFLATRSIPTSKNIKHCTTWIDITSGSPMKTKEFSDRLWNERGIRFIDVGVSGGPRGAAAGTLMSMVGSDCKVAVDEIARPLLDAFSKNIVLVGSSGAGHAMKSINNIIMASNMISCAEGLVSLARFGIHPETALQVLNQSSGGSTVSAGRFPMHILNRKFDYGFSIGLHVKDVDTAVAFLRDAEAHPLLSTTQRVMRNALEQLGSDADHVEVVKMVEKRAGLGAPLLQYQGNDKHVISSKEVSSSSLLSSLSPLPSSSLLKTRNIRLIVADMAGTTIRENGLVYIHLREAINHGLGQSFVSEKDMESFHGSQKTAVIRHFVDAWYAITSPSASVATSFREEKVASIDHNLERRLAEAYFQPTSDISLINPHFSEWLKDVRRSNIKVCLNTGYSKKTQQGLIRRVGLESLVDGYISSEEVPKGRPYPFMIHRLMEKCSMLSTKHVAKVGDSVNDVLEGKNAGCGLVVGVTSGADSREKLLGAGADVVLDDITQLI